MKFLFASALLLFTLSPSTTNAGACPLQECSNPKTRDILAKACVDRDPSLRVIVPYDDGYCSCPCSFAAKPTEKATPPIPSTKSKNGQDEIPGFPSEPHTQKDQYVCKEFRMGAPNDHAKLLIYNLCTHKDFGANATNIAHQSFQQFFRSIQTKEVFECFRPHVTLPAWFGKDSSEFGLAFSHYLVPRSLSTTNGEITAYTPSTVYVSLLTSDSLYSEGYLHGSSQTRGDYLSVALGKQIGSQTFLFGNDLSFWAGMHAVAFFKDVHFLVPNDSLDVQSAHVAACVRWQGKIPHSHRLSLPLLPNQKDQK